MSSRETQYQAPPANGSPFTGYQTVVRFLTLGACVITAPLTQTLAISSRPCAV